MMQQATHIWKEAPFLRLVVPFILGIIFEYYLRLDCKIYWSMISGVLSALLFFSCFGMSVRFQYIMVYGILINVLLAGIGGLLTCLHDGSGQARMAMELYKERSVCMAVLEEPASSRPKSFKARCTLTGVHHNSRYTGIGTGLIIYFQKDSTASPPEYGDRIAFTKAPEKIRNIPGAKDFDYTRYCALQNIYFQVFLKRSQYVRLKERDGNALRRMLFYIQGKVIGILQNYIPGKKECGLAEALLIGYKDDLDKELIRSYSNTGVVHVVAISGLHLGLVYALLKYACIPFGRKNKGRWLSAVVILSGLWLFSLLAGGSPSVLRSAVMFSFIVCGESINRKTPVMNNLAASAFFLLSYNPYWLWDIGFQLSYAALVSIVLFMKPIYHLFIFKNKVADTVWKLNAVTLSAQVLTTPVSIYYFHQFPTLFLVTNFIAVPLSSAILMGEIALCALSFAGIVAGPLGWILSYLLKIMNASVELLGSFEYSAITGLQISFIQVALLYLFIGAVAVWLIPGRRQALLLALAAGILFMAVRFI